MTKEARQPVNIHPREYPLPPQLEGMKLHSTAVLLLQCFSYSHGMAPRLGHAFDISGILSFVGNLLIEPQVLLDLERARKVIHPNMEKMHAQNGYDSLTGIVAVMYGGILKYQEFLENLPQPHDEVIRRSLESVAAARESFTYLLSLRPDLAVRKS